MLDGFGNVPDELGHGAALAVGAIDLQPDGGLGDVTRLIDGSDGANGGAGVKAFANAPGAALFFHVVLQVAARHVQAHGIAVDVLQRIGRLDVFATLANGHHQFDLVVQVGREAGVGQQAGFAGIDHHDGVGRFHEKERRLAAGEAHFLGVLFVVAAHAVDAVHREAVARAHNGHAGHGRGRKNIAHVSLSASRWVLVVCNPRGHGVDAPCRAKAVSAALCLIA